ncbi:hypothetical protein EON81_29935 [bacterium]|nr:MAG: hypothetical protein EON81_29935 [bacterium]
MAFRYRILLSSFATFALAAAASAVPITFTLSAVASGSLNGTSFTDATVTVVGVGDTANNYTFMTALATDVTATISVEGVGADTFAEPVRAFAVVSGPTIGFGFNAINQFDIFDALLPSLVLQACLNLL